MKSSFEALDFQTAGVEHIRKHGYRTLLADEMGVGKTIEALMCATELDKWPCVVVCPAIAKYTWEQEVITHTHALPMVLEGRKVMDDGMLSFNPKIIIINYDILQFWVGYLKKLKPQFIVIDECHNIANKKTKRAEAVVALCKNVPHILAMSGTPLTNKPIELFTTAHLLWPKVFKSRREYGWRYCGPKWVFGHITFDGATHLEELNVKLVDAGLLRRKKLQVVKGLPPKHRQIIPVALTDARKYKEEDERLQRWVAERSKYIKNKDVRMQAFSRINKLRQLSAKLKLKAAVEWIDDFLLRTGEKIVLGCWHTGCAKALAKHYGRQCVLVTGEVSAKERHERVKRFQHDPTCKVFVGNLIAAGTNITLTAASTVGILEFDYRPGIMKQFEDRVWRIGQKFECAVYYFVGRDTIESKICGILQRKEEYISSILDGNVKDLDFDISDMLLKAVLEVK